ncbi:MAG: superoxide dismutase, partial [Methyloceanibacter sp.]
MAFELMKLPYSYDALEPHMSAETLEYHHDKHHQAYVDMLNKLLPGSGFEGMSLEEIIKASYGKNQPVFNNAGQDFNHNH